MTNCAWCVAEFKAATNNQIYCGPECRQAATKHRSEQVRVIKRKRKRDKVCAGGCGTLLSMYNESNYCTICMVSKHELKRVIKEIRDIVNGKIY